MGAWETQMVSVVATLGVNNASYRTIREAFNRINDGTHRGNIQVIINCDTRDDNTATLFQSGYNGTSSYSKVRVYPALPDIRVYGDIDAPLFLLDGADNVTFFGSEDGIGSTRNLTIDNIRASNNAVVFRLVNGATNDSIAYCIVRGGQLTDGTGIITIAGGANNTNVVITQNELTSTSAGRPRNVIASLTASGLTNTGEISNNLFYNFLRLSLNPAGAVSSAIHLSTGSTNWSISGNSFYETNAFNTTNAVEYSIIRITSTTGTNFTISGNFIGGNAPLAAGTWTKTGNNNIFYGINLSNSSTAGNSTAVRGNVIRGFNWTNNANANWTAIHIGGGLASIGGSDAVDGNIIGDSNHPILLNATTDGAIFTAIADASTAITVPSLYTRPIRNNSIHSITTSGASYSIYGIRKTVTYGPVEITDNSFEFFRANGSPIGSTEQHVQAINYNFGGGYITARNNIIDNIHNSTNTVLNNGITSGIWVRASARSIIENNTISNLSSALGNTQSDQGSVVSGVIAYSTEQLSVIGNTIFNLQSTYNSGTLQVSGVVVSPSGSGLALVHRNFIHSLSAVSPQQGSHLSGIRVFNAQNIVVYNNIVFLTTATSKPQTICGIYDQGNTSGTTRLYYNTIYIGGSAPNGSNLNSYGIWGYNAINTRDIQNNLIYNSRTTTTALECRQAAISFHDTPTAINLTLDYNNYYTPNPNGVVGYIGPHSGGTDYPTLADWQGAFTPAKDANSLSIDPVFANPGTTTATDYQPAASMPGVSPLGGIVDDFANLGVRVAPVTMGAWENDCNGTATISPTSILECENETVSFTVALTNVTMPAFAWEESTDGGNNWTPLTDTPPYSGTTSATLTITGITIAMHNNLYRCVVTDSGNSCVYYSDVALLEVNAAPATGPIWHQ